MIDAFAAPQALDDAGLFVEMFLGDQDGDGFANRLIRRVAEDSLGAGIPRGDDAVERLRDDGVVGVFDHCREPAQQTFGLLALGDVLDDADELGSLSRFLAQQSDRGAAPHRRAVLAQVTLLERVVVDFTGPQLLDALARRIDVFGMRELEEGVLAKFFERITENRTELQVGFLQAPVEVRDCNAESSLRKHRGQALFAGAQCALRHATPADVMKHHDRAGDPAPRIADRRRAVFDAHLNAFTRDQRRVIRKPDHVAGLEGSLDRVFGRVTRVFVDDAENALQRTALGLAELPARQLLRDGIEERHAPLHIRGDDGVTDARQRHLEPLALLAQLFGAFLERQLRRDQIVFSALARTQDGLDVPERCRAYLLLFLVGDH
jgi:hypothetical protein